MKSRFLLSGRRYLLLTAAAGFIFVYLLSTEVYDRYSNTLALYQSLGEKHAAVLNPILLAGKSKMLTIERDSLSALVMRERDTYQQNEIGVIQCVSVEARKNQVSIESFNPGGDRVSGQFNEYNFGVSVRAKFRQVGFFINKLETETIPFDITKIQMISDPVGSTNLHVNIQAKASLYHGIH